MVSICAIVISLVTLIVAYIQTDLMSKQQKANAMPYLEFMFSDGDNKFSCVIINSGLGPAFVKAVSVVDKGKEHKEIDLVKFMPSKYGMMDNETSDLWPGRVIKAGEVVYHIAFRNISDSLKQEIRRQIHDGEVILKIKYASIYGDEWLKSTKSPVPIALD